MHGKKHQVRGEPWNDWKDKGAVGSRKQAVTMKEGRGARCRRRQRSYVPPEIKTHRRQRGTQLIITLAATQVRARGQICLLASDGRSSAFVEIRID